MGAFGSCTPFGASILGSVKASMKPPIAGGRHHDGCKSRKDTLEGVAACPDGAVDEPKLQIHTTECVHNLSL